MQSRGGKGLLNYHVDKYGDVAAIKVVDLTDDVILISSDGILIRIPADSIRICARPSKGVRVMRVTEGSRVVTLARTAHEEDEDTSALPQDEDDAETAEDLEGAGPEETEAPDSLGDPDDLRDLEVLDGADEDGARDHDDNSEE